MLRMTSPFLLRRGFGFLLATSHDGLASANRSFDIARVELTKQVHRSSEYVVSQAFQKDPALFG
jgi:hypothetical protein